MEVNYTPTPISVQQQRYNVDI